MWGYTACTAAPGAPSISAAGAIALPVFFFEARDMGPACMMGMPVPQDFTEMIWQKSTRLESLAGAAPVDLCVRATAPAMCCSMLAWQDPDQR